MKTTLDLPEKLLAEVVEISGKETPKAAIMSALEQFVYSAKLSKLRHYEGTMPDLQIDLDTLRGRNASFG